MTQDHINVANTTIPEDITPEALATIGEGQIAYVKPSLRAVRIPIEELERILTAGFRPMVTPHANT